MQGGVFNVGSGEETTVLALHAACVELGGDGATFKESRRGSETSVARCSNSARPSRARLVAGDPPC